MDETTARFLISEPGADRIRAAAAIPGDSSTRVLALRKHGISLNEASGAVEIVAARERARRRGIEGADQLFFTEEALAQATSPALARYRAERLTPFGIVADLCCGIGMDAIALAEAGAKRVIAVDTDPTRLVFAEANATIRGVADRIEFRCEPVEALGWRDAEAAFFDPARRTDIARVSRHADRYSPQLDFLATIREHVRGGAAKLSPALPDEVLAELDASRIEFLSEHRECKEACVWFGEAAGAAGVGAGFAAVLLASVRPRPEWPPQPPNNGGSADGEPLVIADSFANHLQTPPIIGGLGGRNLGGPYLLDPDPAVLRAGLLETLCDRVGASFLSPDDSYLTADSLSAVPESRAVSAYRILEALPFAPKPVAARLRALGVGRIVVKKRHFPREPEAVARELGVSVRGEGLERTLVLVRQSKGKFLAVLCEPVY